MTKTNLLTLIKSSTESFKGSEVSGDIPSVRHSLDYHKTLGGPFYHVSVISW